MDMVHRKVSKLRESNERSIPRYAFLLHPAQSTMDDIRDFP